MKQIADLLEDVDFGKTLNKLDSDYGLGRVLKRTSKTKKRCGRLLHSGG
jgi:hypothetical protein